MDSIQYFQYLLNIIKTPKLQFIDSGLLAMLMDVTVKDVQADKSRYGHVLERFALPLGSNIWAVPLSTLWGL